MKSQDVLRLRPGAPLVLFDGTGADGVVSDDTNGVADVFMCRVCHDTTTCVRTTTWVAVGANGLEGNGPSFMPRGNNDAWVGPGWATFVSDATNFWSRRLPTTYCGAMFRARTC